MVVEKLILFFLTCIGITQFIVKSHIGLYIRENLFIFGVDYHPNIVNNWDGLHGGKIALDIKSLLWELFHCSMCTGFWVGAIGYLVLSDHLYYFGIFSPEIYGFTSLFVSHKILDAE